jgi:hypothetical protein
VASYLNLKRCDILRLLCVCKKMTIKVLRELFHVTGYYPGTNVGSELCPRIILKSTRRLSPSFSFDLHPLLISLSYTSSWWRIFKNPFPIHRLIINLKYKVVSSEPLSTLWDLSNLNSLVIMMSEKFDQNQQVSIYDDYSCTDQPLLTKPFDQYQLPSSKKIVLLNTNITPKILEHLNTNLESIELVNCQLEPPWYINLKKLKYLKRFTICLKSRGDTSCESWLDLTRCTMKFPGISKRLKFKDDPMLKVL